LNSPTDSKERAARLCAAAGDLGAQDVVALDVAELTSFADVIVLATGTSDRHVRAVADTVLETAKAIGAPKLGVEGYDEARWVLIDLGDVIFHVFLREAREYYDLDRLWGDAPGLKPPAGSSRHNEAGG
jgi:ribosome-associated protein